MHGGLGRGSTFNFMAAIGPDFKKQFVDPAPASNADIEPTLARILGLKLTSNGELNGRVLQEAVVNGPSSTSYKRHTDIAEPAINGRTTVLMYQQVGKQVYFDRACFTNTATSKAQTSCP